MRSCLYVYLLLTHISHDIDDMCVNLRVYQGDIVMLHCTISYNSLPLLTIRTFFVIFLFVLLPHLSALQGGWLINNLEKLKRDEGMPVDYTDRIFGVNPPVSRCLGLAGDVFLVNPMTVKFEAPNASMNTRYALYYKVKGYAWEKRSDGIEASYCEVAMLDPWNHWLGLSETPTLTLMR